MTNIFLVFGYGVPKNIFTDENYIFYLNGVFNKIYDLTINNKNAKPLIIFSGGNNDFFKPYKRCDADEMIKLFKKLSARPFLKNKTKHWQLVAEKNSISTLENLLFTKKIITKKVSKASIYIFCEATRAPRIKTLSTKIFGKNFKCHIMPIDFDVSSNRYLDPDFIANKEKTEIKHTLWALKSPANLKKHHQVFKERTEYIRKIGGGQPDAVKKWWDKKLKELEN